MRNTFFIITTILYFSANVMAENNLHKSGKYLTNTLENIVPLNFIKELGKKITKFGGKEIFFGGITASILSEGLTEDDQQSHDIIQTNNLTKVYSRSLLRIQI